MGDVDPCSYLCLFPLFLCQYNSAYYRNVRCILAAGLSLGAPPMLLALTLAFSSSLMMSLTHYGTGTAPIIFGSGYATLGEWWKTGFVMSVVNLAIWFFIGSVWWKFLGYW